MSPDSSLSRAQLEEMVATILPDAELHGASHVELGHSRVYQLTVDAPATEGQLVLKAVGDANHRGVGIEARMLAILDEHTLLPVPSVIGVFDAHEQLPSPFFLMERVPGSAWSYERTVEMETKILTEVAHQTGEYLASLHSLDAVEAFGTVEYDRTEALQGERPTPMLDHLGIREGTDVWKAFLLEMVEQEIEALESSRFADLCGPVTDWFESHLESNQLSGDPVLGRIDHGVHNLLFEPDTGSINGVLDWEFLLAVTPGYDLQCVEYVLSGAILSHIPGQPDRREIVREAIIDGYDSIPGTPACALEEYRTCHDCYELLATVRSMVHLDSGLAKVPQEHESAIAEGLRAESMALLEDIR